MNTLTVKFLNPTTVLVTGSDALVKWREKQTLLVPGHQFTPRFKRGQWDGYYSPGAWCRLRPDNLWELRCSRGLVGRLATTFRVVTVGAPDKKHLFPQEDQLDNLRDYQKEAMLAAMQHQWGRIALATNAGKGAIIALLAASAAAHKIPVLILCDELAVFDALEEEITKWTSLTPGHVVAKTKTPPTDQLVTIAMVPTLARRLADKKKDPAPWQKWTARHGMVLIDEADKATAPTWRRILANAKQSHWRLGFSGTFPDPQVDPYADLKLDELMGPVLIQAKNRELVAQKISATPFVTLYSFNVTNVLDGGLKDWWEMTGPQRRRWVYEATIMNNDARHQFIQSLIQPGVPTAIIVNRVAHGQALTDAIPGAVFLDGSANAEERQSVLTDFQQGKINILIVTKILDRGTNRLGHTADLLFVSGEGSNRQTLQRIGRGLRRAGGKEFLRLVDVIDRVDLPRGKKNTFLHRAAKYLHGAGRKRIQLYNDEGFAVEIANG